MATQAYYTWDRLGRPFKVARPIREMVAYAKAHGIAVLGTIGNEAHLTKAWPEDHTPFSFTAQPVKLPLTSGSDRYWVCACDIANSKGLGAAILRDARAGRLGWLKYLNVAGKHYVYSDGFKAGWDNPDQHIHLSCFSDELNTSIGDYDPLGADMANEDLALRLQRGMAAAGYYKGKLDNDFGDESERAFAALVKDASTRVDVQLPTEGFIKVTFAK